MRTACSLTASRSIPRGMRGRGACMASHPMHGREVCVAGGGMHDTLATPTPHPREQNDWQTGVKTLPCRNFVAGGN